MAADPTATVSRVDQARLARIDKMVEQGIAEGQMPGAVVVVGHRGQVVYQKAFGERAVEPAREPMTLDTIFDSASLTKVVATTSAVIGMRARPWSSSTTRAGGRVAASGVSTSENETIARSS